VTAKYDTMGFNLRYFEDEKKARLGIAECSNHGLLTPFPVLYEKDGEYVAQFKFTVALTATGLQRITGIPLDLEAYKSQHKISDADLKVY
jgi:methionine aminopeptidase